MSGECRPPVGTPDGAVCNLIYCGMLEQCEWRSGFWVSNQKRLGPERVADLGWRFHSLTTPPEDKP